MSEPSRLINNVRHREGSNMLVLHKHYNFTPKDIGKIAILANFQRVKILTVIREAGELHSVYGVSTAYDQLICWDSKGQSEIPELNIVMLCDEDERK